MEVFFFYCRAPFRVVSKPLGRLENELALIRSSKSLRKRLDICTFDCSLPLQPLRPPSAAQRALCRTAPHRGDAKNRYGTQPQLATCSTCSFWSRCAAFLLSFLGKCFCLSGFADLGGNFPWTCPWIWLWWRGRGSRGLRGADHAQQSIGCD